MLTIPPIVSFSFLIVSFSLKINKNYFSGSYTINYVAIQNTEAIDTHSRVLFPMVSG